MTYGSHLKKAIDYALYGVLLLGLVIGAAIGFSIHAQVYETPSFTWTVPTHDVSVPARTNMTCTHHAARRNDSGGQNIADTNVVTDNQSYAPVTVQVPVGATCVSRRIP